MRLGFVVKTLFYCDNILERTDKDMWEEFNNNPVGRRVGDCAVRAVAKALDVDWETAYLMLVANGFAMGDMPSSDSRMGRFVSRDGSEMAHKLREMMHETTDDGLKAEIRRLADKMESM